MEDSGNSKMKLGLAVGMLVVAGIVWYMFGRAPAEDPVVNLTQEQQETKQQRLTENVAPPLASGSTDTSAPPAEGAQEGPQPKTKTRALQPVRVP